MTTKTAFNFDGLLTDLGGILKTELSGLLEAAQTDIDELAAQIAPRLTTALAAGDTTLTAELTAQLQGLVELNNIRGINSSWRTIRTVASTALRAASAGLSIAVGALA